MNSERCNKITVSHKLEYGHIIGFAAVVSDTEQDPGWIKREAGKIFLLVEDRVARHKCELVSDENPSGIPPKVKTKEQL